MPAPLITPTPAAERKFDSGRHRISRTHWLTHRRCPPPQPGNRLTPNSRAIRVFIIPATGQKSRKRGQKRLKNTGYQPIPLLLYFGAKFSPQPQPIKQSRNRSRNRLSDIN
jgi:hypothetical protein